MSNGAHEHAYQNTVPFRLFQKDEVRSVSSTGGEKGTKLARFDLIPAGPLTKIAEHFGIGASKYADRNWEKGYEWSKSYAALQRHLVAWWGGEDNDPELGSSHLQAAGFHVLALLEYLETHPEFDDRPTTQARRAAAGLASTEEFPDLSKMTLRVSADGVTPEFIQMVTGEQVIKAGATPIPTGTKVLVRYLSIDGYRFFDSEISNIRPTDGNTEEYEVYDVNYLRERWVARSDLFVQA